MSAINEKQLKLNRAAVRLYSVNKDTLRNQRFKKPARQDCAPNSKLLIKLEERAIIEHALDVDSRGFQLNYDLLRSIANKLLANRGSRCVGVN